MWSLKKLHRAGELAAAVAVIASLIFVGAEVAQNNQISIETSTQRLLSEQRATYSLISESEGFACIYVRGAQNYLSLSGSERLRFSAYALPIFQSFEAMHILMQRGRIEPEIWQGQQRILLEALNLPGLREWYATRRHWFGDDFQQYVEKLVGQLPGREPVIYEDPACPPATGS